MPAGKCVVARNLTEPQRAMFHYFAGITSQPASAGCDWLVVHTSEPREPKVPDEWHFAWQGTRPGDDKEFFWLFVRVKALALRDELADLPGRR